MQSLFDKVPQQLPGELIERLMETSSLRIERIVSHGHASPDGFWYDQADHEWVLMLQGRTRLRFEDSDCSVPPENTDEILWTYGR